MIFSIFSKITRRDTLSKKMLARDEGVYIYILFPIAVAFLIAFIGARLISHFDPQFFLHIVPGVHVHHFAYGILLLSVSGYLALVNESPRSRYYIALLHGVGLGLAFDEFGIWLRLSDASTARASYDGVVVLLGIFVLLISAESGSKMWRRHFGKKAIEKDPLSPVEKAIFEPPSTP